MTSKVSVEPSTSALKYFWHLVSVLWTGERADRRRCLSWFSHSLLVCIQLLLTSVAYEALFYFGAHCLFELYRLTLQQNLMGILTQAIYLFLISLVLSLLNSTRQALSTVLGAKWRQLMTSQIHGQYFSNRTYYHLNCKSASFLDYEPNSLSRGKFLATNSRSANWFNSKFQSSDSLSSLSLPHSIIDDIEQFSKTLSKFLNKSSRYPFIFIFYGYKLIKLHNFPLTALTLMYYIVSLMAVLVCKINPKDLLAQLNQNEMLLRQQHQKIFDNSESIAFLSGDSVEYRKCDNFQDQITQSQVKLAFRKFFGQSSSFVNQCFTLLIPLVATCVLIATKEMDPQILQKDLGILFSNIFIYVYLTRAWTQFLITMQDPSLTSKTTERIGKFESMLREANEKSQKMEDDMFKTQVQLKSRTLFSEPNTLFMFDRVTIRDPLQDQVLLENWSLTIKFSQNCLLYSDRPQTKNALVYVMRKFWPVSKGNFLSYVNVNDPNIIMFLTSRPLLHTCTLLELLLYPSIPDIADVYQNLLVTKEQIMFTLKLFNLDNSLLKHVHFDLESSNHVCWAHHLSPDEAQLVNLVRMFFHRPMVCVLDDAMSNLTVAMIRLVYRELDRQGIQYVTCTVSVAPEYEAFHEIVVKV